MTAISDPYLVTTDAPVVEKRDVVQGSLEADIADLLELLEQQKC